MKRLVMLVAIVMLVALATGCASIQEKLKQAVHPEWNGQPVLQVTVSKHLQQDGEGAKNERLQQYRDFDSVASIFNALQDRHPAHVSPQQWPEYAVEVEFTDHSKKNLLHWLGAAGAESALLDESEKGDSFSLSARATDILRNQIKS